MISHTRRKEWEKEEEGGGGEEEEEEEEEEWQVGLNRTTLEKFTHLYDETQGTKTQALSTQSLRQV